MYEIIYHFTVNSDFIDLLMEKLKYVSYLMLLLLFTLNYIICNFVYYYLYNT